MQEIMKCSSKDCPWRKECIRHRPPSKLPKFAAYYVDPWTNEGCPHFLTTELLNNEKLKNPTKDI